jgi:hypothetical protein
MYKICIYTGRHRGIQAQWSTRVTCICVHTQGVPSSNRGVQGGADRWQSTCRSYDASTLVAKRDSGKMKGPGSFALPQPWPYIHLSAHRKDIPRVRRILSCVTHGGRAWGPQRQGRCEDMATRAPRRRADVCDKTGNRTSPVRRPSLHTNCTCHPHTKEIVRSDSRERQRRGSFYGHTCSFDQERVVAYDGEDRAVAPIIVAVSKA